MISVLVVIRDEILCLFCLVYTGLIPDMTTKNFCPTTPVVQSHVKALNPRLSVKGGYLVLTSPRKIRRSLTFQHNFLLNKNKLKLCHFQPLRQEVLIYQHI